MTEPVDGLLFEVKLERDAQDKEWGQQDHPDYILGSTPADYRKHASEWKHVNDARAKRGKEAWDSILLEEVYEALSEPEDEKKRQELIQVAAVCLAWVEAIDRRNQK